MVNLKAIKQMYNQNLKHLYHAAEVDNFIRFIAEDFMAISFINLKNYDNKNFSNKEVDTFKKCLTQLASGVPYQYITGFEYFAGLKFKVSNAVLIPRPETEELVKLASTVIKKYALTTIADFGTGSGCIAIALQYSHANATIIGLDISEQALKIANFNNSLVANKVQFLRYNILDNTPPFTKKIDVLISNPPYIPEAEKQSMHINVINNEPALALFTPNKNANIFYKKLATLGLNILNNNGFIFFEIHYLAGEAVILILQNFGYKNIQLLQSIFGQNRFVVAQLIIEP